MLDVVLIERMQGADLFRDQDADDGEDDGGAENPEDEDDQTIAED
jgi:hypothetical protein